MLALVEIVQCRVAARIGGIEWLRRSQGLGGRFMHWMNDRARRKHKTFTIDVLKNSRAKTFAERLGFRVVKTNGNILRMRLQDGA